MTYGNSGNNANMSEHETPSLSLAQVAEMLGVSKRTVVRLASTRLQGYWIGGGQRRSLRFKPSDVEKFLEQSQTIPTEKTERREYA